MNQGAKPTNDNDADQKKLEGALNTIAEVLVRRDLESMRSRVGTVESSLTERIESVKGSTTSAIDKATKDLSLRVEGLVKKLDEAEGRHKAELAKVKAEAKADLDNRGGQLTKELSNLASGLSAVQLELQQQMMASERVSGVLSNMANVFTGPPPAASPLAGVEENLDDAIGQMFDEAEADLDLEAGSKVPAKR